MFQIHCSSGTYIRSLCRDMAVLLSTCGVMSDIIRTKCGFLDLKDAVTLEELKSGKYNIIKMEEMFDLDAIDLTDEEGFKVLNGVKINSKRPDGSYKIFFKSDFLGVGEVKEGILKLSLRLI